MTRLIFLLLAFLFLFLILGRSFFWIYIVAINVLAMGYMYYDKYLASSGKSKSRIPEARLLNIAFWGGAPFMLVSMFIFRHKLLKPKFLIGVPILLIWNLVVYYLILRIIE